MTTSPPSSYPMSRSPSLSACAILPSSGHDTNRTPMWCAAVDCCACARPASPRYAIKQARAKTQTLGRFIDAPHNGLARSYAQVFGWCLGPRGELVRLRSSQARGVFEPSRFRKTRRGTFSQSDAHLCSVFAADTCDSHTQQRTDQLRRAEFE